MKYNNDPFMEESKVPAEPMSAPAAPVEETKTPTEEIELDTIAENRNEDDGDVDPAEPVEDKELEETDAE